MALEAETVLRPLFLAAGGGDGEVSAGREAPPVFLATAGKDWPVDPMIWGDEKRMKRELLMWAKAVASMAASSNTSSSSSSSSSSPSRSTRRRG